MVVYRKSRKITMNYLIEITINISPYFENS